MEIKQFEHLESKIIALIEFVERQKKDNAGLSLKIKELEERLLSVADDKNTLSALERENNRLKRDIESLNRERVLIKGQAEALLGQVEKMEAELKWNR